MKSKLFDALVDFRFSKYKKRHVLFSQKITITRWRKENDANLFDKRL